MAAKDRGVRALFNGGSFLEDSRNFSPTFLLFIAFTVALSLFTVSVSYGFKYLYFSVIIITYLYLPARGIYLAAVKTYSYTKLHSCYYGNRSRRQYPLIVSVGTYVYPWAVGRVGQYRIQFITARCALLYISLRNPNYLNNPRIL